MENIEKKARDIKKQLKNKNILNVLNMVLTLSPTEKTEVSNKLKREFDIDLSKLIPPVLKTIGSISIYRIAEQKTLLSSSISGNNYLTIVTEPLSKKIASIIERMIKYYKDELEDADLLNDAENILEAAEDENVDFEDVKNFIEELEDDYDCKKNMDRLIHRLKNIMDSKEEDYENKKFDLSNILLNDQFRPFSKINLNLIAINLKISEINDLGFFLTKTIDERDFILIKPYNYLLIEELFFIGLDKLKENMFCPICENKESFSQYIDTSIKLITICKECSHIINSKEEF